jgi:hypothetical protein
LTHSEGKWFQETKRSGMNVIQQEVVVKSVVVFAISHRITPNATADMVLFFKMRSVLAVCTSALQNCMYTMDFLIRSVTRKRPFPIWKKARWERNISTIYAVYAVT